ncbi:MAG: very short patch repair endonuclease [Rubrobacteraceae bacterium]|jgi:DNA mismatch endonuclease (patch repair protein)
MSKNHDTLSPEQRSKVMSRVKNKDTKPEMRVRRMIHAMGYRYRIHRRKLPGSPDLVFPERRKVIFVHGCFWHHHEDCKHGRIPKSRPEYWVPKLEKNMSRDIENQAKLREMGWDIMVIWECETEEAAGLPNRIMSFLEDW